MPYCPRCGVEIEDRLDTCPLCDTHIPDEVRDNPDKPGEFPEDVIPPKPMYKELTKRQKRIFVTSLIIFLGFFPIAVTAGIDISQHKEITWSYYVMVPVVGVVIITWFFYRFSNRPIISVTVMMIIVLVIQILLGEKSASGTFSVVPILSFFLISFIAIEALLFYCVFKKPKIVKLLYAILLDGAFFVGALNWITSSKFSWSLIVISCILPVFIYLIYIQHTKKRGLNVIGFFFFDLALMLLAIDYTTSHILTWSIITTMIFVVIGVFFYVLHISLFNDTDWRKALHL